MVHPDSQNERQLGSEKDRNEDMGAPDGVGAGGVVDAAHLADYRLGSRTRVEADGPWPGPLV